MREQTLKLNKTTGRARQNSIVPKLVLALLLLVIALPFATLIWIALNTSNNAWPHLLSYVLPRTIWQTSALLAMVALGTTAIGAGTAWLTTMCNFPGRKTFVWLLVLPLAIPTYIAAYAQVEFFDFTGLFKPFFAI